jgi:hypothetical protein
VAVPQLYGDKRVLADEGYSERGRLIDSVLDNSSEYMHVGKRMRVRYLWGKNLSGSLVRWGVKGVG